MTDLSEEDHRILSHLREQVKRGEAYVRSRQIAEAVDLTAKQVGARLARLSDEVEEEDEDLEIEQWSRSRSTTWRISKA